VATNHDREGNRECGAMPGKAGEGAAEVEIELQVDGDDEFGEEDGACDAEAAAVQATLCVRRVHLVGGACTVLCLAVPPCAQGLLTSLHPKSSTPEQHTAQDCLLHERIHSVVRQPPIRSHPSTPDEHIRQHPHTNS
jgi:hypothetical protein